MSPSRRCGRCAGDVPEGYIFCPNCGLLLGHGPEPTPVGPPAPRSTPWHEWSEEDARRHAGRRNRTSWGLTCLMIGVLLAWNPFAWLAASPLILIGSVLLISGAAGFGEQHTYFAAGAVVLFSVSWVLGFVFGTDPFSLPPTAGGFRALLLWDVVLAAIGGLAFVLLTYVLQDRLGKVLLGLAYASRISLGVLLLVVAWPLVDPAYASGPGQDAAVHSLFATLDLMGLASILTALLYAGAFWNAKSVL